MIMNTSDKIAYENLFSTDINIIRQNIEFGTYKGIEPNIIIEINKKIASMLDKKPDILYDLNSYIYYEITDESRVCIAKYLNLYYIDDDIDGIINIKSKTMEQTEELISWIDSAYSAYYDIKSARL